MSDINNPENLDMTVVKDNLVGDPEKDTQTAADSYPLLPKNLHWAIKAITAPFPEGRKEAMAVMSLSMLGTLGGDARFRYRNNEVHYLGFETFLVAKFAGGKSAMTRLADDLLSKLIDESDKIRELEDAYDDECNRLGEDKDKPKDPHYAVRVMLPKTTRADFIDNIKYLKGKRAIIYTSEVDSLHCPKNWCMDGGALERFMFDTDFDGQSTKTTKGTKGRIRIAMNLCLSGTPLAMKNHYSQTENGTVSRVAFCTFPPDIDDNLEETPRTKKNYEILEQIQDKLLNIQTDIEAKFGRTLESKSLRLIS